MRSLLIICIVRVPRIILKLRFNLFTISNSLIQLAKFNLRNNCSYFICISYANQIAGIKLDIALIGTANYQLVIMMTCFQQLKITGGVVRLQKPDSFLNQVDLGCLNVLHNLNDHENRF